MSKWIFTVGISAPFCLLTTSYSQTFHSTLISLTHMQIRCYDSAYKKAMLSNIFLYVMMRLIYWHLQIESEGKKELIFRAVRLEDIVSNSDWNFKVKKLTLFCDSELESVEKCKGWLLRNPPPTKREMGSINHQLISSFFVAFLFPKQNIVADAQGLVIKDKGLSLKLQRKWM